MKLYCTGKSLSESLTFALTNPQYEDRLLIELQVQYMKSQAQNMGTGNAVERVQRVHEPADLWDITFCTR